MNYRIFVILISLLVFGFLVGCQNAASNGDNQTENGDTSAKTQTDNPTHPPTPGNQQNNQTDVEKVNSLPEFDNEENDFGDIIEGNQLEHTFKIFNKGTEDLILTRVRPTCGCTAREYTKEPIPPNGEGFIKTTVRTNRMVGKRTKTVNVYTNSKEKPEITLYLKFNAIQVVTREPQNIHFSQVIEGEERIKKITLSVNEDLATGMEIKQIREVMQPNILSDPQIEEVDGKYEISFTLNTEKVKAKIINDTLRRLPPAQEGQERPEPNIPKQARFNTQVEFKINLTGMKDDSIEAEKTLHIPVNGQFEFEEDPNTQIDKYKDQ